MLVDMQVAIDSRAFSDQLLRWWDENGRRFPWRTNRNPYRVLVSEILLHRTKAEQVAPVYKRFLRKYPDLWSLSQAEPKDVKTLLRSLGLFWRTDLLLLMTAEIVKDYDGIIPSSKEDLDSLPGISEYISSAVMCFAYESSEVLLETNTVRILGRIFGVKTTDSSRRTRKFQNMYAVLLNEDDPRKFSYAMIDLGALVCTPRNPRCDICPVCKMCQYGISRIGGAK